MVSHAAVWYPTRRSRWWITRLWSLGYTLWPFWLKKCVFTSHHSSVPSVFYEDGKVVCGVRGGRAAGSGIESLTATGVWCIATSVRHGH